MDLSVVYRRMSASLPFCKNAPISAYVWIYGAYQPWIEWSWWFWACFLFLRCLVRAAPNAAAQLLRQLTAEITNFLHTEAKPNAITLEREETDKLKRATLAATYSLS